jgi:prephenate dehydratase
MTFKESIDVKKLINKQTKSVGKVAIQGYEGSFHQIAAKQYFGENVKILPCANFRDVVKLASSKKDSIGGVMAIENSIVGSILPNYTLLEKSNLKIVGEVYLKIEQHLMIYPGTNFEDIKEVHSHPMALLQCLDYLEKHNWKLIETEDTALSAKNISKKHSQHVAVIASQLAADLFDLEVVAPNIHTEKNNFTRFLILQPNDKNIIAEDANKASINFKTNHTKGSLAKVLSTISNNGINLSKLQSMPIVGTNFKYSFHADLEFKNIEQFNKAITAITALTEEIKIYGIYKDGNINE